MRDSELQQLVEAWISLHHADPDSEEHRNNFWAYGRMSELCSHDPELCWHAIHRVRRRDSSEVILANLASGPVEDLLATHGEGFIERVEKVALEDEQFRRILGAVWQNEIDQPIWERIKAVAGSSW